MFDKWFDWLIEAPLVIQQLLPLYIVLGIIILTRVLGISTLTRDWLANFISDCGLPACIRPCSFHVVETGACFHRAPAGLNDLWAFLSAAHAHLRNTVAVPARLFTIRDGDFKPHGERVILREHPFKPYELGKPSKLIFTSEDNQ